VMEALNPALAMAMRVAVGPSPWGFGWEALVAIGTLALAGATLLLAISTRSLAKKTAQEVEHTRAQAEATNAQVSESRRQVEASQEQARIAHEALNAAREQTHLAQLTLSAQIRPVLIDVPLDLGEPSEPVFYAGSDEPILVPRGGVHVFANEDGVRISVPLRNAGAGLAMIRGIALEVGEPIPLPATTIQPANVPRGERGRVSFVAGHDHPRLDAIRAAIEPSYGTFSVAVSYSDLAGQHLALSRFDVSFRSEAHMNWEVRQVHLSAAGSDEPFAGSAPVA
jgi:hypothetical protein